MQLKDTSLLKTLAFIDGAWVGADDGASHAIRNPSTGTEIARVPDLGANETGRAIAAADTALPVWRAKSAKEVRLKAFWGVFNQSLKRLALYEYSQRKQADKKAAELTEKHNSPHFVQPVKEVIEEK